MQLIIRLTVLIISAALITCLPGVCAWAQPPQLVKAEVVFSHKSHPQGVNQPLALKLVVVKGYHINSHEPQDDSLIPTKLTFKATAGFIFSSPIFPKPTLHKVSFLPQPIPVYGGITIILFSLKVSPQVPPGLHHMQALLSFQGCNDQICLMPEQLTIPIRLKVVKAGTLVEAIDNPIFKNK